MERKMEVRNVSSVKVGEPVHSENRAVWLTKYKCDKVKVSRNEAGEVVKEVPFSEIVYQIFVAGSKSKVWLPERLLPCLLEVLDVVWGEGDCPSSTTYKYIRDAIYEVRE